MDPFEVQWFERDQRTRAEMLRDLQMQRDREERRNVVIETIFVGIAWLALTAVVAIASEACR